MANELPIYILHGWSADPNNQAKWQSFISSLKNKAEFVPLPGLDNELSSSWGLNDYVEYVSQKVGSGSVVLVGHSFGGQIAIALAAKYPQKVVKLVLIDSAGLPDTRLHKRLKVGFFYILAKLGKLCTHNERLRHLLYHLAGERDYLNATPIMRQTMAKVTREYVTSFLPKITVPTLIIWGENDQITPLFMGKRFQQGIRNSVLKVLSSARHSPQFTHTEVVTNLINDFIN